MSKLLFLVWFLRNIRHKIVNSVFVLHILIGNNFRSKFYVIFHVLEIRKYTFSLITLLSEYTKPRFQMLYLA